MAFLGDSAGSSGPASRCELPVKYTFIHFEDDLSSKASLERCATCPRNFAPAASVFATVEPAETPGQSTRRPLPIGKIAAPTKLLTLQQLQQRYEQRKARQALMAAVNLHGSSLIAPKAEWPEPSKSPDEDDTPTTDESSSASPSGEEATTATSWAASEEEEADSQQLRLSSGWKQVASRKKDRSEPAAEVISEPQPRPSVKSQRQVAIPSASSAPLAPPVSKSTASTAVPQQQRPRAPPSPALEKTPRKGVAVVVEPRKDALPFRTTSKFEVGIVQDEDFNVMRRLLVPAGGHMRRIAELTGAKLTVRGRGSGHPEGSGQKELDEPLSIFLCSTQTSDFALASQEVQELVSKLKEEYNECASRKTKRPAAAKRA